MCERVEELFAEAQWEPVPRRAGDWWRSCQHPQSRGEGQNYWLSPRGKVSPGSGDTWEALGKEERIFSVQHTLWSGAPREPAAPCPARRVTVSD